MNNIDEIMHRLLPPNNYQYREGFSNDNIIDSLGTVDRGYVEDKLIDMLSYINNDDLIVTTLAYMKSEKSIPALRYFLEDKKRKVSTLIVATAIYRINRDENMIPIAVDVFLKDKNRYSIIFGFYFLGLCDSDVVRTVIRGYIDNSDYLISYNAKRALGKYL